MPITDNNLIEELLGEFGIICLEDIIDSLTHCSKEESHFNEIKNVLWPIQLAPKVEGRDLANIKHDATGQDIKKKTTKVVKGGYLGLMGDEINDYIRLLI
jgi:large subunit ribosomal protein L7e